MPIRTAVLLPGRRRLPERLHHRRLDPPEVDLKEPTSTALAERIRLVVACVEASLKERSITGATASDRQAELDLGSSVAVIGGLVSSCFPEVAVYGMDGRIECDHCDPLPWCRA